MKVRLNQTPNAYGSKAAQRVKPGKKVKRKRKPRRK
jgi:hypothetical protein